jgi:hypothetical protein
MPEATEHIESYLDGVYYDPEAGHFLEVEQTESGVVLDYVFIEGSYECSERELVQDIELSRVSPKAVHKPFVILDEAAHGRYEGPLDVDYAALVIKQRLEEADGVPGPTKL